MPEFAPSEPKTAVAPITVKPSGLSCEAEIFLGPDEMSKVATSGRIPFTSIGTEQSVDLPITMPDVEGPYHVYIDVYAEGLLVAAYQALEDVVISAPTGLSGTVTDKGTGTPLELVLVSIAAPYEQSTFTDVNGYYAFPKLAPGSYTLYFNKDGYWVERVAVTFITAPHELNVKLTPVAVGVDYFDSCEVPSQISRDTLPYPDLPISSTEEFFAKHTVYLTVSLDKLYTFELLASTEGVTLNPAEYARPWYGISEDMVRYMWERTHYLPTPVQRTQLFPVETEGLYTGRGVSNWGQAPWAAALQWNISSVTVFPVMVTPPRGVYKIISQCSIISCQLEPTGIPEHPYTIRTWGQWIKLWEVDTGKTIKVI